MLRLPRATIPLAWRAATSAAPITSLGRSAPATTTFLLQQQHQQHQQQRGMKVYTKTGDKGTSQLFSGERRPKDDDVFEALGATDELNGHIGVAIEHARISSNEFLPPKLTAIQSILFDVGACVATPNTTASNSKKKRAGMFNEANVTQLEQWIDIMDAELPPIKQFVLPSGGGLASTNLHIARSVCRRAERRVVPLVRAGDVEPVVGRYLNRLSDFLFVSARYAAFKEGREENKWVNMNLKPTAEGIAGSSSGSDSETE